MLCPGFCSYCGGRLEERLVEGEERKRLVCVRCQKIHYKNPIPVVVGVITKPGEKKVGLIKRAIPPQEGRWALPGGFVEIDESPEEALLREIKEEVGISGRVKGLISVCADESKFYKKVVVIGYEVGAEDLNFSLGREVKEFKFFSLKDHPPLAFPSHQKIIQDFKKFYRNPVPTVDAIVEEEDKILLVRRKNSPYGWALPGGFVDYGETLEDAVRRELKEETNLDVKELYQFHTYSDPGRDPRFHTISTVFVVKAEGRLKAGDDAKNVGVFSKDSLPPDIAFDHARIIKDYFQCKRLKEGGNEKNCRISGEF
ncbi:NUDIX hydrolase [Candidatus Aerophobetes bacterium]|nr:NUDIX hydrolase [Candidatus Aerophobetes bacterium]